MFPGISTGGGGFTGSSSADSRVGDAVLGGFTFSPKSGVPAWAIAGIAALALVLILRK